MTSEVTGTATSIRLGNTTLQWRTTDRGCCDVPFHVPQRVGNILRAHTDPYRSIRCISISTFTSCPSLYNHHSLRPLGYHHEHLLADLSWLLVSFDGACWQSSAYYSSHHTPQQVLTLYIWLPCLLVVPFPVSVSFKLPIPNCTFSEQSSNGRLVVEYQRF
jgi:hypothetical protein